jgi:ATP-dependent DNA helicase RecG
MTESETQQLLNQLIEEGESEFVEFKKNHYENFEELGKYFSALSNGACLRNKDHGFLIFGIDDQTHDPIGKKRSFEENGKTLELYFRTHIHPKTKFEIHSFLYKAKPVSLLKFAAAKGEPVSYIKTPWGRIKSHLVNLLDEKYSDLLRKIYNSSTDWSAQIVEDATIQDLDEEAIKKAKEKFKERRENSAYLKEIDQWTTETFLTKTEVLRKNKITNAALILLGKRESRNLLKDANAAEITWSLETEEKSYEHFYPPFLTATSKIWQRIRNTKYKLFPAKELLAIEVNKYDEEVVLEAIHNCIAHQDYHENSRIIVSEKVDCLIFTNAGSFFEGKAEDYAIGEKKALNYRNPFLIGAMVNLGMIDKMGYGIRKMFLGQKKKFFPLPDYSNSNQENVILKIYGRIIDEKFSQILIEKDLDLPTVISLDRIQKNLPISDENAAFLRKQKLLEGRKPNYFITAEIASITNQEEKYLKTRGADNQQLKDWVLLHLSKFKEASREKIDSILMRFLPDNLPEKQKKKRVENLLQRMARDKLIKNIGTKRSPKWVKLG